MACRIQGPVPCGGIGSREHRRRFPGHLQDRLATLADDVIALAEPPERCGGVAALRAPQARDADAIVAAGNDDDIRRWTELPIPYRRADALDFIERMSVSGRVDGSMVPFVAVDTHDEVLGCPSVHNIDARARARSVIG